MTSFDGHGTGGFTEKLRSELVRIVPKADSEAEAETAGFFCCARAHRSGIPALRVRTDSESAELLVNLLKKSGISAEKTPAGAGRTAVTVSAVSEKEFISRYSVCYSTRSPDILSSDTLFRRAFLRGAFLLCGYCSDPGKTYRIELHIENAEILNAVIWMLHAENIQPSVYLRDRISVVCFREGDLISDFLALTGASSAMLEFENVRAERELNADVNRTVNCDSGNSRRQSEASARRTELFSRLLADEESMKLPPELKDAAMIHIANPGLSIAELGELMSPPIGKSGMNHRLIRLEEIAKSLD